MTLWQHLYITPPDPANPAHLTTAYEQLQQQIPAALESAGFKRYDPFGLMPVTRAYAQVVRLFLSPPDAANPRWLKIITAPESALPETLLEVLSQDDRLCLVAALEDQQTARISVYRQGRLLDDWQAALASLSERQPSQPNQPPANITPSPSSVETSPPPGSTIAAIPTDGMPDELRAMADKLSGKQIQKLMNRMSGKLLNAEQQQQAQDMLTSTQADWGQSGGQQIAHLMDMLHISHWRTPDYVALRDAYQLQSRLKRNPNALLYPGDQDAIDAVPTALVYIPIFAGSANP